MINELKRKSSFYDSLHKQQLERWAKPKVPRKLGRPVDNEFEAAVLRRLVFARIEKVNEVETLVVKANNIYTYENVREAAEQEKALAKWRDNEIVAKLSFLSLVAVSAFELKQDD